MARPSAPSTDGVGGPETAALAGSRPVQELPQLLAAALRRHDVAQAQAVMALLLSPGPLVRVVDDVLLPVLDAVAAEEADERVRGARVAALRQTASCLGARLRMPRYRGSGHEPVWVVDVSAEGDDPRVQLLVACLEDMGCCAVALARSAPSSLAALLQAEPEPVVVVACAATAEDPALRELLSALTSGGTDVRAVALAPVGDPGVAVAAGAAAAATTLAEAIDAVARLRAPLTRREHEVLALVAHGMSNKQIARELGVAPATVKAHLDRVYQKLDAPDRAAAAATALRAGWIT